MVDNSLMNVALVVSVIAGIIAFCSVLYMSRRSENSVTAALICGLLIWAFIFGAAKQTIESSLHSGNLAFLKSHGIVSDTNESVGTKAEAWIKQNIEKKNQDVFEAFAKDLKKMAMEGDQEGTFFEIDQRLMEYPFCIQGDKDLNLFESFAKDIAFENDKQRRLLDFYRDKYDYKHHAAKVPSKADLACFCGIKGDC
jgi:hypothetical protein